MIDHDKSMASPHQTLVDNLFESDAHFWGDVYSNGDLFGQIHQERLRIAISWVERLSLPPGSPVLDAGAGAGIVSLALAHRGLAVRAIDAADAMVNGIKARARHAGLQRRINVRRGDVHALPFDDAAFEAVVSLGVIPWLHSPRRALLELVRVMRPDGWLIVNCDNRARLHLMLDPWFWPPVASLRRAVGNRLHGDRSEPVHAHAQFRTQFQRMIADVGLRVVEDRMFGFGPFTLAGRTVLPDQIGRWTDLQLTRFAEAGVPVLRATGSQYIVLCKRQLKE